MSRRDGEERDEGEENVVEDNDCLNVFKTRIELDETSEMEVAIIPIIPDLIISNNFTLTSTSYCASKSEWKSFAFIKCNDK